MKKILLLSDTHSYLDERLIKHFKNIDEVWHAGDIGDIKICDGITSHCNKLRAVFGNIDNQQIRSEYQKDLVFTIENIKVWITHIGGYPPNYTSTIKQKIQKDKIDLFVCGHSHILKIIYDKNLNCLHLNPGAIGKYGIHQIQTALLFDIEGKEIKNMRIIELDKLI